MLLHAILQTIQSELRIGVVKWWRVIWWAVGIFCSILNYILLIKSGQLLCTCRHTLVLGLIYWIIMMITIWIQQYLLILILRVINPISFVIDFLNWLGIRFQRIVQRFDLLMLWVECACCWFETLLWPIHGMLGTWFWSCFLLLLSLLYSYINFRMLLHNMMQVLI